MEKKDYKSIKNYIHNELNISKEEIRDLIKESVKEEARKIVHETFEHYNVKEFIEKFIFEENWFGGINKKMFNERITEEVAKIISKDIGLIITSKEKKS